MSVAAFGQFVALFVLVLACMDLLCMYLRRHAVEVQANQTMPEFRFSLFGTFVDFEGARNQFVCIKLPSWRHGQNFRGRWEWQQLHVLWTSAEGWRAAYLESFE